MKRLLISAAALALLSAPAAYAQQQDQDQHDHHHDDGGQGGQRGSGGQPGSSGQGGHQGQGGSVSGQGSRQGSGGQSQVSQGAAGSNGRAPAVNNATVTSRPGVVVSPGRGPASPQPGGRPDWDAYVRNNPDLQRAYKQNQQSPTYHESLEAFAQRHYQEHGKAEGRALPTVQGGAPQSQGWGRAGASARDWRSLQRNFTSPRRFRLPDYRWPRGMTYRRFVFGDFLPTLFIGPDYYIYDYAEYGLPYPPPGTVWVRYGPDALLVDRYSGEVIEVAYNIFYY